MVKKLGTIEELIKRAHDRDAPPLVIKYFATWCDPCKKSAPWFDDLARKFSKIEFASVDIDDVPLVCTTYGVRTIPAVHVWNRGSRVEVFSNRESFPKVESMLIKMLEHDPYASYRCELESAHVNSVITESSTAADQKNDAGTQLKSAKLPTDAPDTTPINARRDSDATKPVIVRAELSKSEKRKRDV